MKKSGTLTIDGFPLSYSIEGEGIPVLVVGSTVYYSQLFTQEIKKKLQFFFVDHRGFVKPPRSLSPEDYQLNLMLDDIESIRQMLNLEEFVILGHSGHAFMALEYARKYPECVKKVVLLNSAPTNSKERQQQSFSFFRDTASDERKRQFEKDIALLERDIEKDPERRFVHMCIRMGAQSFYDYTFDATDLWEGVYTNMQIIDHLWGEVFGSLNLLQSLKHFNKPVFIGLGRYDYLVAPVSLWDPVEDLSLKVEKVIFEHSGHNPMLEEPHEFNKRLVNWIYEVDDFIR
ncbi:alpha/beta fold hydrolase [Melghirimyces algeriensis]|uniref:Proline iminopeptidase n=1 Tax=Melghirimyces algeriensis TaxID=910412 RepID=A0A521DLU8_9BACL|nr:alpha/beta hydrolase [Melghirimyces algeriensis]SMO71920.1 proline iminopeptidase [Melghirimyces algeriensis]